MSQFIGLRVGDNLYSEVEDYRSNNDFSNTSQALRSLLEIGIAYSKEKDGVTLRYQELEKSITERVGDSLDQLIKVNSRGTKASLASLLLMSTFLPHMSAMENETAKLILEKADLEGLNLSPIDFNMAAFPLVDFFGVSPQDLFEYFWDAGGKIQKSGSKADYATAVKGLRKVKYADVRSRLYLSQDEKDV